MHRVHHADVDLDVAPEQQAVVAGASQITTNIPPPAVGATIWVQLRTVNGAGIPSVIGSASYTVPQPVLFQIRR